MTVHFVPVFKTGQQLAWLTRQPDLLKKARLYMNEIAVNYDVYRVQHEGKWYMFAIFPSYEKIRGSTVEEEEDVLGEVKYLVKKYKHRTITLADPFPYKSFAITEKLEKICKLKKLENISKSKQ